MISEIENKILFYLESGYDIDTILKELNIDKEVLADIIIELEIKGLISLEDKNWKLTKQGKDILKEIKIELLRKLKIDYLYGNINKEEFNKKRNELESIIIIEKIEDKNIIKIEEKNIICSKCGKENKPGSKYCYKCGEPL